MQLSGKRIALIGGAGFIGHNLALSLKSQGADVSIIDGLQVNHLLSLHDHRNALANKTLYLSIINERIDLIKKAGIPLFVEDVRDYHRLNLLFEQLKPEVVVFLAAVSHASRSNKDPYHTFDHSFRTLENALDASRDRVDHFIYFSSSMVYGNFEGDTVLEGTECNPLGIYGALKYGGEKLVIAYNQVFGLDYTIIRPSALYGERCISRRVSQIFIENALSNQSLVIKGEGEEKLDFTYIGDLVSGVECVIANPKSRNEIFNLTYGQARSLLDLASIVQSSFPEITIQKLPRDSLVPERGTLSVSKAMDLIDYRPQNSIDVGMPKYISWYREFYKKKNISNDLFTAQVNE